MKHYIYIDKEYADREHMVNIFGVFDEPLKDAESIIDKPYYLYIGENIPHYITVEDDGTIREATEYEKYTRGQRELSDNEVIIDKEIVQLYDGEYFDGKKIIKVEVPDKFIVYKWENNKWVANETKEETIKRLGAKMVELLNDIKTRKELAIDCSEEEKELEELKTFYKGLVE